MRLGQTSLILGLTGAFGSGCSTVARILESEHGFHVYSISGMLRRIASETGIDLGLARVEQREKLQHLGNEIRQEEGHGALIRRALQEIASSEVEEPIVIDSIKNPGEIAELRKFPNGYVMAIDASFNQRWNRVGFTEYHWNQGQFRDDDERDKGGELKYGQQVERCVDLADIIVSNDDDWGESEAKKQDFTRKVREYVGLIKEPKTGRYPSVDELLMNAAYSASTLSRCLSRKVGAVISKQEPNGTPFSILAMGHNHIPRGGTDCKVEYGECLRERRTRQISERLRRCPWCGKKIKDGRCSNSRCDYSKPGTDLVKELSLGRGLDICPALHAEESAILQASLLGGPSLEGCRMFATTQPCMICAKMIAESGIQEVVYVQAYPMEEAVKLLEGAGVRLKRFEGVKAEAFYKLFRRDWLAGAEIPFDKEARSEDGG